MEENCSSLDYYKILQCDKNATIEEIKKNYQRLALNLHPDKNGDESEKQFILIQKAWSVLRDPESRKLYDAELSCQEHSELLLYDTIPSSDMDYMTDINAYTYSCRCGGTYILEAQESLPKEVVVCCDTCSLSIVVNLDGSS